MWGRMSGKKQTTTKPRPVGRNPAAKERCTRARMGTGCKKTKGKRAQEKCEKFYSNFNCLKSK